MKVYNLTHHPLSGRAGDGSRLDGKKWGGSQDGRETAPWRGGLV